jgi:cell wall-associated NlpC family hydrolase
MNLFLICLLSFTGISYAENLKPAVTSTISTDDLVNYKQKPPAVKKILEKALDLTKKDLTYSYGSADPKNKGMDCSGTIYYLLHQLQIDAPRQSDQIYLWAVAKGKFNPVKTNTFDSQEFAKLRPGDLLFWTGTYAIKNQLPALTHIKSYLNR